MGLCKAVLWSGACSGNCSFQPHSGWGRWLTLLRGRWRVETGYTMRAWQAAWRSFQGCSSTFHPPSCSLIAQQANQSDLISFRAIYSHRIPRHAVRTWNQVNHPKLAEIGLLTKIIILGSNSERAMIERRNARGEAVIQASTKSMKKRDKAVSIVGWRGNREGLHTVSPLAHNAQLVHAVL
jgi:hypothetical protein